MSFHPSRWSAPWRYALAVMILVAALLLRLMLLPVESPRVFLCFYPAVTLTFLLCGSGPGRLAVLLSTDVGYCIFEPQYWSFGASRDGAAAVVVFVLASLLIGWIVARLQATSQQLSSALSELHANESFLNRTGRVAGVGGWQIELADNRLTWSEQTRRIHEVGAVVEVEAAQVELVGLAFAAVLTDDQPRGCFEQFARPVDGARIELLLGHGADAGRIGHADRAAGAAGDDDGIQRLLASRSDSG